LLHLIKKIFFNVFFRLKQSQSQSLATLKTDRFLADADWSFAERACSICNPYAEDESDVSLLHGQIG